MLVAPFLLFACTTSDSKPIPIDVDDSIIIVDEQLISHETGFIMPTEFHFAQSTPEYTMYATRLMNHEVIAEIVAMRAMNFNYSYEPLTKLKPSWLDQNQVIEWNGAQKTAETGFGAARYHPFQIDNDLDCFAFKARPRPPLRYIGYFCVIVPEIMTPERVQSFLDGVRFAW